MPPEERQAYLDRLELAAAALDIALAPPESAEAMPAQLAERIRRQAATPAAPGVTAPRTGRAAAAPSRPPVLARLGWIAAAACLAVAVVGWWPRSPSASSALEGAADLTTLALSATEDELVATDAGGEIRWSASRQAGVMNIRGLAVNDPSKLQYQLWIFDARRSDKYPVDGGVFDITEANGAVEVPIDAKLPVSEATLFAITVEPPGGSVVSDRRIVLLAKVDSGP
jgi:anti-sigma-K factor RskA